MVLGIKALSELTLGAEDFLNARFGSNRLASPLVALAIGGPKHPTAREKKTSDARRVQGAPATESDTRQPRGLESSLPSLHALRAVKKI